MHNEKIVESKIFCRSCKSKDLQLIEVWAGHEITWDQVDGKFDRNDGNLDPGYPSFVEAHCKSCGKQWRLRNIPQIDYVIKD